MIDILGGLKISLYKILNKMEVIKMKEIKKEVKVFATYAYCE